jgi:hypothetical protein
MEEYVIISVHKEVYSKEEYDSYAADEMYSDQCLLNLMV